VIIIGVVASLAAGAILLPSLVTPRVHASRNSCISILKQLDAAKATWALEQNKTTNDTPLDSDLFGPSANIRDKEACPQGGTYTIGKVGEKPRCSLPMHSLDFGWVMVRDEEGKPVQDAHVTVLGRVSGAVPMRTDTDGLAGLAPFPGCVVDEWTERASGIAVSCSGFQSITSAFPSPWPVRIVLKREP